MKIRKVVFVVLIICFSICVYGQSGQTGSIEGKVKDADLKPLPGVSVTLTSPSLVLTELTCVSNSNGVFRFPNLPPGEYRLVLNCTNMNKLIFSPVRVNIGKTTSISAKMTLKGIKEEVKVIGTIPNIERRKTTGLMGMNRDYLDIIPGQGRTVMNYFNLVPGINENIANGSGEMENSYNLDGVNLGDPVTGTEYVSLALETLEEISVQTGGLSAEFGSVKGAVLDLVTKSGGNDLSGSAYFYFDNEHFQANNTKGTDLFNPQESEKTGRKFQLEPGITLGGPIIKNKLWFFGNLSMISKQEYVPGYPHDKPATQAIPMDQKEFFPYFKLTYRPSKKDKIIFSYSFSDLKSNHRGANRFYNEDTTQIQNSPAHVWNFQWNRTFGDNLFSTLKVAFVNSNINFHSKAKGAQYYDWITEFQTGTNWRNSDDSQRNRLQVNFDTTTFIDNLAGSHEFKIGGEMQFAKTRWILEVNPDPITGLVWQFNWPEYIQGNGIYYGFHMEPFDRKDDMLNASFYVNDTWNLSRKLTLNIGFRFDYNSTIWPTQNQDEFPIFNPFGIFVDRRIPEKITAVQWYNLSPRLGMIYDFFADGSFLFKFSWSRYVQPNTTQLVNMAHPNGWYYWIDIYNGYDFVQVSQSLTQPGGTKIGYNDYDLTAPIADEITVGLQSDLGNDWNCGIRYIKKWDRNLLHVVDAASLDIDTLMETGGLVWKDWEEIWTIDPYTSQSILFYNDLNPSRYQDRYIVNPPGAERNYDGMEFTMNKVYSRGWSLNVSYVYAKAKGLIGLNRDFIDGTQSLGTSNLYINPNAHINAEGWFPFERRHQLKFTGMIKGPWGINIGGYFRHLSGHHWTRAVTSDYLGLNLNQITETIKAEERGAHRYPAINLFDLRIQKIVSMGKLRLKLFADIFNVFNDNTVTEEYLDSSNPALEFGRDLAIVAPRVVRLGAKIEF